MVAQPGDIAPRLGEARHKSGPHWVTCCRQDDRDRPGGVFSSLGPKRAAGHYDVHLEPDQLSCEIGEPLSPPLRRSVLEDDVLALDVAQLVQLLSERLIDWVGAGQSPLLKNTDPIDLPRLLRLGGERRGEEDAAS